MMVILQKKFHRLTKTSKKLGDGLLRGRLLLSKINYESIFT